MARLLALAPPLGVALFAVVTVGTVAQSYPRLHVLALTQRADRASVAPRGVFVVTIRVKVAQPVDRLDELILGSFENCQIISNENVRTTTAAGTAFTERLTVQALAPGDATIGPAYIDALDPSLGKPMRFSSNAVRVHVTGGAPLDERLGAFADSLRRLLLALAIVAGLAAAVFVLAVLFFRRRKRPLSAAAGPAPVVVAPPTGVLLTDRLRLAARGYERDRSAPSLASVRAILFELARVEPGATLVDALRALGGRDPGLRTALLAAERAAFGPETERASAGNALLTAVQAYVDRGPANQSAWTP